MAAKERYGIFLETGPFPSVSDEAVSPHPGETDAPTATGATGATGATQQATTKTPIGEPGTSLSETAPFPSTTSPTSPLSDNTSSDPNPRPPTTITAGTATLLLTATAQLVSCTAVLGYGVRTRRADLSFASLAAAVFVSGLAAGLAARDLRLGPSPLVAGLAGPAMLAAGAGAAVVPVPDYYYYSSPYARTMMAWLMADPYRVGLAQLLAFWAGFLLEAGTGVLGGLGARVALGRWGKGSGSGSGLGVGGRGGYSTSWPRQGGSDVEKQASGL